VAGIAGTTVVHLLSPADGHQPVYAPERLVGRIANRFLHRQLSPSQRRRYGTLLRWLYGPSWGAVFGAAQGVARIPYPAAALALGTTVWAFELMALPLSGATPALKKWGLAQIAGDGLQTVLYGIATASALALLDEA